MSRLSRLLTRTRPQPPFVGVPSRCCTTTTTSDNHFRTLRLSREAFDVDHSTLSSALRRLQAVHHPDRAGDAGLSASAAVNAAYDALCCPHTRAAHLLALRGLPTGNAAPQFLAWVMSFRADLDDAVRTARADDVTRLYAEFVDRYRTCLADTATAFADQEQQNHQMECTARLQYFNTIKQVFDDVQPQFGLDLKKIAAQP